MEHVRHFLLVVIFSLLGASVTMATGSHCAVSFRTSEPDRLTPLGVIESFARAIEKMSVRDRRSFFKNADRSSLSSEISEIRRLRITDRQLRQSWKQPIIISRSARLGESTVAVEDFNLVLFGGHIFPGNYFQVRAMADAIDENPGRAINASKFRRGFIALALSEGGQRASLVRDASKLLREMLIAQTGGRISIYRGASQFQFDVLSLVKSLAIREDELIPPSFTTRLREVVEAWYSQTAVERFSFHEPFAAQIPVWRRVVRTLESRVVTKGELQDIVWRAFASEYADVSATSSRVVTHNTAIFATPDPAIAYHWAFDHPGKLRNGLVLRFDLDLEKLTPSLLEDLYVGIEGEGLELGFFGSSLKSELISGLSAQPLRRDDDPRSRALWRRNWEKWNAELKSAERSLQVQTQEIETRFGSQTVTPWSTLYTEPLDTF